MDDVLKKVGKLEDVCDEQMPLPLDVRAMCYVKALAVYYWRFAFRGLWRRPRDFRKLIWQLNYLRFRIISARQRGL